MYTAREDLITHLDSAKTPCGIETLKAYSGELSGVQGNPKILSTKTPACLVLYVEGALIRSHGRHELDLVCVVKNRDLNKQDNAADALLLGENVIRWIASNHVFTGTNISYQVDLSEGIDLESLLVTNSLSIARVGISLQSIETSDA